MNVPLIYPEVGRIIDIIIREKIKIVFTSAGNPSTWTSKLKDENITVAHVVSSVKFARKSQEAGVDAIVAEGFEAGGHNGREETTTFCLVPMVRDAVEIPLIAAGGIATGRGMLGAMALGAEGVQVGSRFAASEESSAHQNFKDYVVKAGEGATELVLKQLTPVRILKNDFYNQIKQAEVQGVSVEQLKVLLAKGRAKKGIFEGDLAEGELEIGQVSATIDRIKPAAQILKEIWLEYNELKGKFCLDNS